MQTIELLAPAKNIECGIAAIDHGADAVYIGATKFGARQAAGNSVDDIAELCRYAHRFGAKVHVTVNTIVYDNEMPEMLRLIEQLEEAGTDALLIQDMGLLAECRSKLGLRMALHASTQCDTRTPDKVRWLNGLGFERVVLARELSAPEIMAIHKAVPDVELEVFVHGALCVSYSGVCYASQHCFGRSANRGACAQFCRLAFDLKDSDGKIIEHARHLLSLKDMNQINNLETLMRAGACAFKIEGRLKDVAYVKNVVSAYSRRLNEIIARHPDKFKRASLGRVDYFFEPNLNRTFNRGYTDYFFDGRKPDIFSPDTPKAFGEFVGRVKEIGRDSLTVAGTATFSNGDGMCFVCDGPDSVPILEGFRINRAIGNRLYPFRMPKRLRRGMSLYRNEDHVFEKLLGTQSARRRIPLNMRLCLAENGFLLKLRVSGTDIYASGRVDFEHQSAQHPQVDNIRHQLTKLGTTVYVCNDITLESSVEKLFIPSSVLAELRRKAVDELDKRIIAVNRTDTRKTIRPQSFESVNASEYDRHPYLYNISNRAAAEFYRRQGLSSPAPAFECAVPTTKESLLMQCRHCIKYSLGYCLRHGGRRPSWREPLFLELADGRRFKLDFDCEHCQMNIIVTNS